MEEKKNNNKGLKVPGKAIGSRLPWRLYKRYYHVVVSRFKYKISDAVRDAVQLQLELFEAGLRGEDVGEYARKWWEESRAFEE